VIYVVYSIFFGNASFSIIMKSCIFALFHFFREITNFEVICSLFYLSTFEDFAPFLINVFTEKNLFFFLFSVTRIRL